MHYSKISLATLLIGTAIIWSCQSRSTETGSATNSDGPLVQAAYSKDEAVKRGRFIVDIGGCNDCHTPKKMTPHGPAVDSSRMLSGHPAGSPLPSIDGSALKPGNWMLMAPDITAFVGPWGVTYAANLTADSATGIGAWTEEQFIGTMRKGKHLGMDGGRPVLPPMPWEAVGKLSDDDLKALLAYLKTVPAISNRVPGPVSPDKVTIAK